MFVIVHRFQCSGFSIGSLPVAIEPVSTVDLEDNMKRSWVFPALFGIAWLSYPTLSLADYVIHLKSGHQFITKRYWKEGGEIKFNYSSGILGFSKDLISSIEERAPAPREAHESEPAADETVQQQGPEKAPEKDRVEKKDDDKTLQHLIEKKRILKKKLDGALARLREASGNKDAEAKKKARDEMRDYANQLYALTDEAKEMNNGQLPEGWWQD
jgi:hypothetical protein